jgi:hypothetical protein
MKKILYSLTLILVLISCNKDDYVRPEQKLDNDLVNSTWVITRYDHALSSEPTYVSDTIYFVNKTHYKINLSELERRYDLTGSSTKYLRMYSLTTLGGDFSATLDEFIIEDGYINSAIFNDLHVADSMSHGYVLVWMNRVE